MKKLSKEYLRHSNDYEVKNVEGCLYIIATPIGNFDDISLRAIQLLKFVDILLCEDTRKTKKLLAYLNIKRRNMISYNDNNAINLLNIYIDLRSFEAELSKMKQVK